MKLTVWPLKWSGTLLKQHCSITLTTALVPISVYKRGCFWMDSRICWAALLDRFKTVSQFLDISKDPKCDPSRSPWIHEKNSKCNLNQKWFNTIMPPFLLDICHRIRKWRFMFGTACGFTDTHIILFCWSTEIRST